MSINSTSQFALTSSVEALKDKFAQLSKLDEEKFEFTSGILERLVSYDKEISSLKWDLEAEKAIRVTYQQKVLGLQAQTTDLEQIINKDPYVVVLVDGDGCKFQDNLLTDPVPGAETAAQRLTQEVKDYLKNTNPGAVDFPILVRVFANLNGLAKILQANKVINVDNEMRIFAEQFTLSRAEFDFINVGYGKENADSKIRKMFHFYMKNFQCKKVFFAGCHDGGYSHLLREYVGDADTKKRIVLVETTPATPEYAPLGFDMTHFDTVFRSEPLPSEKKQTYPTRQANAKAASFSTASTSDGSWRAPGPSTSPPPPTTSPATSSSQGSNAIPSISASRNGGVSITYPPNSYAAAGIGSEHQNITLPTAKSKNAKTILYNAKGHRLDPPIKQPAFNNNPSQETYKAKAEKIKPKPFCNSYYLAGSCPWGDGCDKDHRTKLTPGELAIHRFKARTSPCPKGPECHNYDCPLSHHCLYAPNCTNPDCRFTNTRHGDLHYSREQLDPKIRWTAGEDEPTYL